MTGIILNEDFDLKIEVVKDAEGKITSGLVLGDIDYQRSRTIAIAQKGDIKGALTLGFGIENYMRDTVIVNSQKFKTELQKELKTDGMDAQAIVSNDNTAFKIVLK